MRQVEMARYANDGVDTLFYIFVTLAASVAVTSMSTGEPMQQ